MIEFRLFYVFFGVLCAVSTENSLTKIRRQREPSVHWGYTEENGPSTWGWGVCQTGQKQSPINIQLGTVIVQNYPVFVFGKDYLTKHKFLAKNNGHTIYVALEDDTIRPVVHGGGLKDKFVFQQLHFHWESEHEFDGKRADLEMHVVHYNSKYKTFEEASTKPDGIAVLAVIFDEAKDTDNLIEEFFAYILDGATLHDHPSHPVPPGNNLPGMEEEGKSGFFALRDLLPNHVSRFFRYDGSLTTPGCGEVVQWTVFINRLPVSKKVLEAVRTLRDHYGNVLSQNFRPSQKLNGREVYIQIKNYDGRPDNLNNSCNTKALISVPVLNCCLFLLLKFN